MLDPRPWSLHRCACGTELAYGATLGPTPVCGTEIGYGYDTCSTELAYGAMAQTGGVAGGGAF
eukprot:2144172-Rhodomonas_salina.1